jgi:hypothetical protein
MAARHDRRVDSLGFAKEIEKRYAKPLNEELKAGMAAGDRKFGEFFEAVCSQGDDTEIKPALILGLFEKKRLTRPQLLRILKVSITEARQILDQTTFNKISRTTAGSKKLDVRPKPGLVIELEKAITTLRDEMTCKRLKAA